TCIQGRRGAAERRRGRSFLPARATWRPASPGPDRGSAPRPGVNALPPLFKDGQDALTFQRTAVTMIRDARETDLETIVRIYNAAIPGRLATADTQPVSTESRRAWFRDRDVARYPLWVFELDGHVGAWLSFARFYGRP